MQDACILNGRPFDLIEGNAFLFHLPSYLFNQPSDFHLPPAQDGQSTGDTLINWLWLN